MNTITKVTKTKEIFTPTLFMVSPNSGIVSIADSPYYFAR